MLLAAILCVLVVIAVKIPKPLMTGRDYALLSKKQREASLPVIAVKGDVEVSGEVSVQGPVEVDTSVNHLSVVVENASLPVAPAELSDPFPIEIKGGLPKSIKAEVTNLNDTASGPIPVQVVK